MDRGGCVVILFVLIVLALIFAFGMNTGLFDQLSQELQAVDGTASVLVVGSGEGTPAADPNLETAPVEASTPEPALAPTPVPNGRILLQGLDGYLWSVEADGTGAARLGLAEDFLAVYTNEWVSPDNRYVFVYQEEAGKRIAYVIPADGQTPGIRLGELPENFGVGEPRSYFDFSTDSRNALFFEAPFHRLVILNLDNGQRIEWPVQPEAMDFNTAAFVPGRAWVVIKGFDSVANGQFLEVFNLGETLSAPQRSQVFVNERIHQFELSPDGTKIAQVHRNTLDGSERVILVREDGQVLPVLQNSPTVSLMTSPAWSPDGRYLLINSWQREPQPVYRLLSYDTQTGALVNLLGDQPSTGVGQPISVAAGFAPDGAALNFRLYNGQTEAFWLAFLDGSYARQVAGAAIGANPPNGEFVAGFTPTWDRMALVVAGEGASENALWGNLAVARIDGSSRQALDSQVPYRFEALGPVISPDGQSVVYFRLLP